MDGWPKGLIRESTTYEVYTHMGYVDFEDVTYAVNIEPALALSFLKSAQEGLVTC